jgi:hypothetical protein
MIQISVMLGWAALTGCTALSGQARSSGSQSARDCAACNRMCEVAGDARENPAAVKRCQADCQKKCG